MAHALQIVVCAGIVPDPLQTLEPVTGPNGPGLKNEMVLPSVLDPWAACALYEAARLAASAPGSKVWLVSLGPKAKLQQVMMTVGQKAAFELVPIDGPIGGFGDAAGGSRCSSPANGWALPTSSRASTRLPFATMVRSKCWSAWKGANTRYPYAPERQPCWDGLRATLRNRATIRKSACRTCAA